MDQTSKRVHVFFSGRVQGVGFRFSACRIAADFSITGYVRNLDNGEVELIAEGTEPELSAFLQEVRKSPLKHYIMNERVQWETASGAFEQFGIYYS